MLTMRKGILGPDTVDLPARAALAVNALTSLSDEALNGQIYFYIRLYEDPPTAYHAPWDYGDGTGRHMDALTLAHVMTGSPEALAAAQRFAELLMSWQGEKGLFWWPREPWTVPGPASSGLWRFVQDPKPEGPVADVTWSARGALLGLTTLCMLTGNDRYRQSAQALVNGLDELAVRKDDYRYFPEMVYTSAGWRHTDEPRADGTSELKNVPNLLPLLRFYKVTGDERALNLAGGLLRFILHKAEGYELDGRFYKTLGYWDHFHSKASVITAAIVYGLTTRQPEYVAWGRQAYEAAKGWGTDFGWFPEDISLPTCSETCCITDMIEIAILLGLHVDPAYLSDAERYGRNHLVEAQFVDAEWMPRLNRKPAETDPLKAHPRRINRRDIVQRSPGSFSGFSGPNDLFGEASDIRSKIMQCCNGAGTRGLYDLWHYAVDDDGQRARVHMAFSRPTAWGEIISHAPYAGRLDLRMKAARSVGIRVPEGASPAEVNVTVNAKPAGFVNKAGYLWLEGLQAGDVASLRYDLPLHSRTYTVGTATYTADFKGNTIIRMTPRGAYGPLYQRDRYRASEAPETEQNWYLPPRELDSL
jgi:hypothetical protein